MTDPYAPPRQTTHAHTSDFEIVGELILSPSPLVLPTHICAKCGSEQAGGKITANKKLYWTPQWVWLTFLITWLLTIILHFILRKPIEMTYYTCPDCLESRKKKMLISGAIMGGGILIPIAGVAAMDDPFILVMLGILMFTGGLIAIIIFAAPPLRPTKYDSATMRFTVSGPKPPALSKFRSSGSSDGSVW